MLGAKVGVRITGTAGTRARTWKSVFAHSTHQVVAESINFAQWAESSIAATFDLAGPAIDNIVVRNRQESETGPIRSYLSPLHPFPTAVAEAKDEFMKTLMSGGGLRPTQWWLVSQWGMPKAVNDDGAGVVHTTSGRVTLPQGIDVDGRQEILEMMMSLLTHDPDQVQRSCRESCSACSRQVLQLVGSAPLVEYLGHAAPSLTQDVYMSRNVGSEKLAKSLDGMFGLSSDLNEPGASE